MAMATRDSDHLDQALGNIMLPPAGGSPYLQIQDSEHRIVAAHGSEVIAHRDGISALLRKLRFGDAQYGTGFTPEFDSVEFPLVIEWPRAFGLNLELRPRTGTGLRILRLHANL